MKRKYNLLDDEGKPIKVLVEFENGKRYHIIEYGMDEVVAMREVLTAKGISCRIEVINE